MSVEHNEFLYETLICLLRSGINAQGLTDVDSAEIEPVYSDLIKLGRRHDIVPIIADQLRRKHICEAESMRQCLLSVHRYEQMMLVQQRLCDLFDQQQVEYILLKGAQISCYYPQPWMRTRSDIDVLVHSEDVDRAVQSIVEMLGYEIHSKNYHDVALYAKNGVLVELHFNLLERQENLDRVLSTVWQHVLPGENGTFQRKMTPEFFLFHHIAHTAYHFLNGGCGVRFIADLWLMQQKIEVDTNQLLQLCDHADLTTFYGNMQKVAAYWFDKARPDVLTKQISDFLIRGTVFGNKENKVSVRQARSGGKLGFLRSRLWWPYDDLKVLYPSLDGRPYLLAFYEFRRWLRLLRPGKIAQSTREIKMNNNLSKEKVHLLDTFMKNVGL